MNRSMSILAALGAAIVAMPATPARATDAVQVIEIHGRSAGTESRERDDDERHEGIVYLDPWTLKGPRNFLTGYPTRNEDGTYNVAVEIPTGTSEKWETCTSAAAADPVAFPRCSEAKPGRLMVQEVKKGARRVVTFLGYPGNYGSLPRTRGADGDPLDIIAVGPKAERGSVIAVKVVGVIRCDDGGDQDDKIIAITKDSPLYAKVDRLDQMGNGKNGKEVPVAFDAAEILRKWFDSYKGDPAKSGMVCDLVDDEVEAAKTIAKAQADFTSP
jgi:inorganic pyrophosphatase